MDWGFSDSLITEIDNLGPNSKPDVFASPCGDGKIQQFTKVVTRSMSSTPRRQEQLKKTVLHEKVDNKLSTGNTKNSPPLEDILSLSNWGLPECVLRNYKKNGIEKMFPWQQECLFTGKVLEGGIEFLNL